MKRGARLSHSAACLSVQLYWGYMGIMETTGIMGISWGSYGDHRVTYVCLFVHLCIGSWGAQFCSLGKHYYTTL